MDFFEDFKPIRNYLRKLNTIDTLFVLRKYISCVENQEKSRNYLSGIEKSAQYIILPNEFDFLIANSIVYCSDLISNTNIARSNDRGKLLLKVKNLEDKVTQIWFDSDIWLWIQVFGLNQNKMYSRNIISKLYRYKTIYDNPKIAKRIDSYLEISYFNFAGCGFWLYSLFSKPEGFRISKSFFEKIHHKYDTTPYSRENVIKTLSILSRPLNTLKEEIKLVIKYGADTFYPLNSPHIFYPIIEHEDFYYCVFPTYILNQITGGVYYTAEIPKANLQNEFGKSFEDYVGFILNDNNAKGRWLIQPEIIYGTQEKKSSDWILTNDSELIFIECKTKRLRQTSRLKLSLEEELLEDINEYAKGITQLYKSYFDYTQNLLPNLQYSNNKVFYPIMITLENWFPKLPTFDSFFKEKVKTNLSKAGIPDSLVNQFEYKIFCIEDFEFEFQIIAKEGISNYYSKITQAGVIIDNEYKKKFGYINYFSKQMEDEYINRFLDIE